MKKIASTIRWSTPDKLSQVAAIAKKHGGSINGLVNQWADTVIAQEAAEASFRAAAGRGDPKRLLALLDKLDAEDQRKGIAGTQP